MQLEFKQEPVDNSFRTGFHSNAWIAAEPNQPGVQRRRELQLSGVRGCWVLLHLLGLNIFEDLKRAFISFPFMIPFRASFPIPCFMQHKGRRGGVGLFPEQLKASQELWALCSTEEGNIYFGLESYCFNYLVIS